MKFLKYIVVAVLALVGAGRTQAQSCSVYPSYSMNYTQYSSYVYSKATTTLHTTVLTDGSAGMNVVVVGTCPPQAIQSVQNEVGGATHQIQVYNKVSAQGAWQDGPTLCASCWNSEENDVAWFAPPTNGTIFIWYQQSQVFCSAGGILTFIGSGGQSFNLFDYMEIAYTRVVRTGPSTTITFPNGSKGYATPTGPYCALGYTPPDSEIYVVKTAFSATSYFDVYTPCVRPFAPGPWFCAPNPTDFPNAFDLASPQAPGKCSHNP